MAQYSGVDDFDDNSLDALKWSAQPALGAGALIETNGNLEFTSTGAGTELQYLAWDQPNYDEDFELVFRAANTAMPADLDEFAGIGVEIYPAGSVSTRLNVRLSAYYVTDFGPSRDLLANFYDQALSVPSFPVQPLTVFPKAVAVRLVYDSTAKVFTVYYDDNPTDGVQWTELATFGIDANANGTHNYDFDMSAGQAFELYVYARTDGLAADSGTLTLDDFQVVAGAAGDPQPILEDSVALEFATQLGESYTVLRSTDLSADPAFSPVSLQGCADTYRIDSSGHGPTQFTGTGETVRILDPNRPAYDQAFYKIRVQ